MAAVTTSRRAAAVAERGNLKPLWLMILALLATAAPLTTDLYLPGFPRIQSEFSSTASAVQLTLTGFFIGMAVGQLAFGSLSDRFGRIRPLLLGTAGAVGSSLLAALAPTLEVFVAARLLQGLCGAAGVVIARAMVVDLTEGTQTVRTMSVMVSITGIAPVVAPSLGAMLVGPIGWRGIMATLAALFLLMLAGVLLVCRETLPPTARGQLTITGGFAQLFRVPRYLGYAGLYATAFATMMAYISASSFVYQDVMGFSAAGYGLLFGVNAVGLVGAGFVSSGLAGRYGPRRLISTAVPALLASSIVVLAVAVTPAPRWILALPILAAVTSVGFILGNASALALQEVRRVSGSGSAFLGAAQFLLGALVAPLAGLGGEHTAVPLGIIMTATAGCAGVLAWVLGGTRIAEHRKSAEQHSEALHDRATFTVRRSVPSDREAILGLMSAARGDARSDAERSEQGFVQGLMDEPILKRLETGPGIFVAEEAESGRLAGFAMTCQPHAVAHNPPAARAVEAAAERRPDARRFVYGPTAVDPVFRGQGVLTMLLLHLCQELGHSYEEGVAFVDHANGKSLAIHTHYGMTALPPFVLGGHTYTPFVFAPDLFARP